jgi:lipoic acid synthetase
MSGPLVRSSYRAGRLFQQAVDRRGQAAELGGSPVAPVAAIG